MILGGCSIEKGGWRIKNDHQNVNKVKWNNFLQFSKFHLFVCLAKFWGYVKQDGEAGVI